MNNIEEIVSIFVDSIFLKKSYEEMKKIRKKEKNKNIKNNRTNDSIKNSVDIIVNYILKEFFMILGNIYQILI